MTAVDRPDNGQDEGRSERTTDLRVLRLGMGIGSPADEGDAGAGEQQRVSPELSRYLTGLAGYFRDFGRADIADELLALLGGPQPDGEAPPCPVYSHDTDGWHCAVTGDHDQHTNAAGDVTW